MKKRRSQGLNPLNAVCAGFPGKALGLLFLFKQFHFAELLDLGVEFRLFSAGLDLVLFLGGLLLFALLCCSKVCPSCQQDQECEGEDSCDEERAWPGDPVEPHHVDAEDLEQPPRISLVDFHHQAGDNRKSEDCNPPQQGLLGLRSLPLEFLPDVRDAPYRQHQQPAEEPTDVAPDERRIEQQADQA